MLPVIAGGGVAHLFLAERKLQPSAFVRRGGDDEALAVIVVKPGFKVE
jgi:hypothetical protein